ncbi:MAG: PBP1A family penicillin-binding protein [Bacillota bacterium]|jgi:1A family penicillin-binding protein|nr:PBP1A family penicillin-binding protein [Candidatus Fermentithermobacillaceae bacterium]
MADASDTVRRSAKPENMSRPDSAARPTSKAETFRLRSTLLTLVKAGVVMVLLFIGFIGALFAFLPLPELSIPEATRIYDVNGDLVSSLFVENRVVVPYDEIPESLKNAVVAVEDKRFFSHKGIDLNSLARALLRNFKAGEVVEGGSTISQQLAKNLFLTHERTIKRKILEAIYTVKLEMRYTKEEILEMYLNIIYLGHGRYGCETASKLYFGKPVKDLTLAESAMLAGIIKGPEIYSPYHDMDKAEERKAIVLNLMVEQGMIDEATAEEAKQEEIQLAGIPKSSAAYFVDFVVAQIREWNPDVASEIYRGGYEVYTTLDLDMQAAAEQAFSRYMPEGTQDAQGITQPQGALVAVEPYTGHMKALIGGRSYSETQLNRAYQVRRQPGSAFKIFLYAAVLDSGYGISHTQMCEPVEFPGKSSGDVYKPRDFGWQPYHYAPLDVRQAVAISDNVVATKWASEVGPGTIIQYARKLGVESPLESNIPLALGASEVAPLEMAAACAALSAQGTYAKPIAILKLVDSNGKVLLENQVETRQALNPDTAYMLTSVLRSVFSPGGTGSGLEGFLGNRPVAGKTGTTDSHLEAWFVGYTRELACAVYVGWDNREESLSGTGSSVAGPIWASFMGNALSGKPVRGWDMPDNLYWGRVCDKTGQRANITCFDWHYELFKQGTITPVCQTNHVFEYLLRRNLDDEPENTGTNGVPYFIPKDAPAAASASLEEDETDEGLPFVWPSGEPGDGELEPGQSLPGAQPALPDVQPDLPGIQPGVPGDPDRPGDQDEPEQDQKLDGEEVEAAVPLKP